MTNSSEALPRFKKPPVIETVLAVHFRPLEKFTSAHQGLLWDRCFRANFPKLEERPPVDEVRELFDEERLGVPMIRWQVSDRPPAPRLWAASEDGQHVVQIQKNALFANWLETGAEVAYRRPYAERRQEFSQQLSQVEDFFRREEIGQFEPTSWSVTYINHIEYEGFHNVGAAVARTLTVWTNQLSDDWLPATDKVVLDFAFPMPDNAGRLNVNITPVVALSDKKQMLRLDLTARGQLKARDLASALAGIDLGHEWIVRGFASLTRPEMHQSQAWERMP
jgi:uncharacterized protein (TIGR04255 family)